MMRSLQSKLIFSYLAVALLTVLVVSLVIRLTTGQSLMNLVVEQQTELLQQSVQEYYASSGSLDGFIDYYLQASVKAPPPGQAQPAGQPPNMPGDGEWRPDMRAPRGLLGLVDAHNVALLPTLGYDIGQVVPQDSRRKQIAVQVDGQTVAWILPDTSFAFKLSAEEQLFLRRTTLAITLAAVTGVLVALSMGFWLAGRLLKPIRRLTRASQALAHGDLNQQVPVTSRDELGLLTTTFNQMSADLVHADQQRKRLTADITHDLSTPLQILSGYVEMLEMGEVALTPQRVEIMKTELGHLRRLVGDLSTLSQVESGVLEIQHDPARPAELLERVYQSFEPIAAHQGVALVLDAPGELPVIQVDEGRMLQVLKNLVENALRYTPAGGRIVLQARAGDGQVQLRVSDNGAGIDAEDLPYVFERFYRADKARASNGGSAGKMGLGLAICKALVAAQGGAITAESAGKGQGTSMVIAFAAGGQGRDLTAKDAVESDKVKEAESH